MLPTQGAGYHSFTRPLHLKKQKTKDKRNLHRPSEGRRSHLEGKQTEARKQANARFDVLLGRLQERGLVEGNPSNLTVDVLKQATRALKQKSPALDDILRLGGNKEQLVTQLEQWLE